MATKKYLIVNPSTGSPVTQESTVDSSAGAGDSGKLISLDGSGKIDSSFMPTGFGADTRTVTAGETLAAGDLIYMDATPEAFKADANSDAKAAIGFVLAGITAAATGTAYFGSGIISGLSGLTAGAKYYLDTTAGGITTTKPSGSGDIIQQVGVALSATELYFEPQEAILLI
jgi:hypothetical protein